MEEEDGEEEDDDEEEEDDDEDGEEENQRRYDFRQRKTVVRYQAPLDGMTSTFPTKYTPVIAPFTVRVIIDELERGVMQTLIWRLFFGGHCWICLMAAGLSKVFLGFPFKKTLLSPLMWTANEYNKVTT